MYIHRRHHRSRQIHKPPDNLIHFGHTQAECELTLWVVTHTSSPIESCPTVNIWKLHKNFQRWSLSSTEVSDKIAIDFNGANILPLVLFPDFKNQIKRYKTKMTRNTLSLAVNVKIKIYQETFLVCVNVCMHMCVSRTWQRILDLEEKGGSGVREQDFL